MKKNRTYRRLPVAFILSLLFLLTALHVSATVQPLPGDTLTFYAADNPDIQYTGRIDFSDPSQPRFWSPGVYIKAKFKGASCTLIINDQVLYGNNYNYLEIVIDHDPPVRIRTTGKHNEIEIAKGLADTVHTVVVCKDTESGNGYLDFIGFRCKQLLPLRVKAKRKIEFIGNSITCGYGSDLSKIACGQGRWYDQHNAYESYGPVTARALHAQWHLTAVSGIGLIHSCCKMKITMPQVYDKTDLRDDSLPWNVKQYQPDVITICLGQNDGIRDSVAFCSAYVKFINTLRDDYPEAQIVCLTSPMANARLTAVLKNYLTGVVNYEHLQGDGKVHYYLFSRSYNSGCGGHPDLAQHQLIAKELTAYLGKLMHWN